MARTAESDDTNRRRKSTTDIENDRLAIQSVLRAFHAEGCLDCEDLTTELARRRWPNKRVLERSTVFALGAHYGSEIIRIESNAPDELLDRCANAVFTQAVPEAGEEVFANPGNWKLPAPGLDHEKRDSVLLYLGFAVAALKAQKEGIDECQIVRKTSSEH